MLEENVEADEKAREVDVKTGKSRFYALVDEMEYEQARACFKELPEGVKKVIRVDKMGRARLQELKFKGYSINGQV